jgi:hypothetical protein
VRAELAGLDEPPVDGGRRDAQLAHDFIDV